MRAVHGFFRIRAAQSETLLVDMAAARFSILFLCKWNAGRSIFAEYLMRQLASQRFEAFSAGVTPVGHVSRVAESLEGPLPGRRLGCPEQVLA